MPSFTASPVPCAPHRGCWQQPAHLPAGAVLMLPVHKPFHLQDNPQTRFRFWPPFVDEKTRAPRGEVICQVHAAGWRAPANLRAKSPPASVPRDSRELRPTGCRPHSLLEAELELACAYRQGCLWLLSLASYSLCCRRTGFGGLRQCAPHLLPLPHTGCGTPGTSPNLSEPQFHHL